MPVEIRELIIRVKVGEEQGSRALTDEQLQWLRKEITASCMEKMRKEMSRKKER